MPSSRWARITTRVTFGTLVGVVTLELVLRAFVTPGAPPQPIIRSDSFDDSTVEWRQIDEGVATSHFSINGARLTGNAPARSGIAAVVIGDSYVLAEQVADRQTMGSRLESIAREHGVPLDVRQYGWSGASPAQYLHVAAEIREHWQPTRVFVVLSLNDFDRSALLLAIPRFRVDTSGTLRIIGDRMPEHGAPQRGSVLLKAISHRWVILRGRFARRAQAQRGKRVASSQVPTGPIEAPPDTLEYERAPGAVIRALSAEYGSSLTVVYLGEPGLRADSIPDRSEKLLLEACTALAVDCVSTRREMAAAGRDGHVSHGLGVVPLGNGHLNPGGHDIAGRAMWDRLARTQVARQEER